MKWYKNLNHGFYVFGQLFNFLVFALIYHFFGFDWFMVAFAADLTNDVGHILKWLYSQAKSD